MERMALTAPIPLFATRICNAFGVCITSDQTKGDAAENEKSREGPIRIKIGKQFKNTSRTRKSFVRHAFLSTDQIPWVSWNWKPQSFMSAPYLYNCENTACKHHFINKTWQTYPCCVVPHNLDSAQFLCCVTARHCIHSLPSASTSVAKNHPKNHDSHVVWPNGVPLQLYTWEVKHRHCCILAATGLAWDTTFQTSTFTTRGHRKLRRTGFTSLQGLHHDPPIGRATNHVRMTWRSIILRSS